MSKISSHRVELEPAFVLHQRPYQETSYLIEAFTAGFGRIGLVAKGARRPTSRMRGILQPFRPLLLSWSGRRELVSLTRAETVGWEQPPAGRALFSGFYINELIMRLLHRNDAHPELFAVYRAALSDLGKDGNQEAFLRIFEKRLLDAIGYGLVLDREAESGEAIQPETLYCYRRDQGPVLSAGHHSTGLHVHGNTLLALQKEQLNGGEDLRESKQLMRFVLKSYLGEKPLATRELVQTLSRQSGNGKR